MRLLWDDKRLVELYALLFVDCHPCPAYRGGARRRLLRLLLHAR